MKFNIRHPLKTPPPVNMILDLTSHCNLSCIMCNVHHQKGVKTDLETMPAEVFEKIVPLFSHLRRITLGGNGEPFIDPQAFERLERIRELNPGVAIDVYTNGTLLRTPEQAGRAIALIDKFQFSINAFTKTVYNSIMVGSDFDRLRQNLAIFREARARSPRRVSATAECIVMRRNVPTLADGVAFCREFGLDGLLFKPLWIINAAIGAEFIRPDEAEGCAGVQAQLRHAEELGQANGVWVGMYDEVRHLYLPSAEQPPPAPVDVPGSSSPRRSFRRGRLAQWIENRGWFQMPGAPDYVPCCDPWETVQVFENGNVFLCCQGLTLVGNLKRASFEAIWNGKQARAYRHGLCTGRYHDPCGTCNRVAPGDIAAYFKPFETRDN